MRTIIAVSLLCILVKLLFVPCYRSTDFEVHRNWLAITYDLPVKEWYFDATSMWTLDYPPFFAYFQWLLAQVAVHVDPGMTKLSNLDYATTETVLFLRLSVITVDVILMAASWLLIKGCNDIKPVEKPLVYALVVFNAGLLLVDHIHFQFNGMLMGVLVLCVYFAQSRQHIGLTVAFSCLVLLKHLFVPLAPIFAIYLVTQYCIIESKAAVTGKPVKSFSPVRFVHLAVIALAALALAFGPFLAQSNGREQLQQIVSRLFPFGRGLVHAYWAPNVWALYCFADKVLPMVLRRLHLAEDWLAAALVGSGSSGTNSSAGIVGDFALQLLPRVSAGHCMGLLLLSLLPALWVVWKRPSVRSLLHCLVYASLSSFMLGYHVHEKAILIPWVLHTFVCLSSEQSKVLLLLMAGAGGFGLFPLFEGSPELLVKGLLLAAYLACAWYVLCGVAGNVSKSSRRLVGVSWSTLAALFAFVELVHPVFFSRLGTDGVTKEVLLPFLPLMTTSVVCALQLMLCWLISLQVMLKA